MLFTSPPICWFHFPRGSEMSPESSGLASICKHVENKKRDRLSLGVGFPGGSDGKESACGEGHLGSSPGLGRSPGGGHGIPLQYSCLENPHGQRSLAVYSSSCRKESDMTE